MIVTTLLVFMLAGADAPATETPKLICKKYAVTGSLVQKRKVCHTRAEWARLDELENEGARRLVEDNRGRPGGN